MDRTALVDSDVEAGRRLLTALAAAGLPVTSAMWLRRSGLPWEFVVASPDAEKHGPKAVYRFVRQIADSLGINMGVDRLTIVDTRNHFSNSIEAHAGDPANPSYVADTGPDDREFEAWVYRIVRRTRPSPTPPKADNATIERAKQAA